MADTIPKEELLRKILNMTTSDNDGQCLVAIRKANALMASVGWDWDRLLAGKIKVIASPFGDSMPNPSRPAEVRRPASTPPQPATPRAPPPRPTVAPGEGKQWEWNAFYDRWESKPDPLYRPRRNPGLGLSRKNLYAQHCYCCGDHVPNEKGFIMKPSDFNTYAADKWFVCCDPCNRTLAPTSVPARPAMKQTGQTTVRALAPDLGKL